MRQQHDALEPGAELAEPSLELTTACRSDDGDDKEPDGGYGWVCVVCQLLITASTWGINGSFGVYLSHYLSTNAFPGTSQASYAFIGGLSQSQITLIAPLVTRSTKTLGTKTTLLIGVLFETGALVAASFATQTWHLYLTQGLLFGWGCSFLYIGTIGIIPQWFHRQRGMANGLAAAGSGIGGLVYSLASDAMINNLGVAWSFRITAMCAAVVNIVCSLLIRDRNSQIVPNQNGFEFGLLKRRGLHVIIAWAAFSILGYTMVLFSLPDNGKSIGLSSQQGSILGALANLGMAVGRPTMGFLSDRYGRVKVVTLATLLASIFCFGLWIPGTSYSVLLAFSVLGGAVIGTSWASIGPLLADIFGTKLLPAMLSIVWTLISIPSCFAEPIALALRQTHDGNYLYVQILAGVVFFVSALCLVALPFCSKPPKSNRL